MCALINMQSGQNISTMIRISKAIPIVILYGPPMCGKTMTLIRLCRYLLVNAYSVKPCKEFRSNPHYEERCHSFVDSINASEAQPANGVYDDMFIEISDKRGNSICYIYDASGDFYMNPWNLPPWIISLFMSANPKIWCFFTEPIFADISTRHNYVQTVDYVYHHFSDTSRDKYIIIHNKIDKTPFIISYRKVDVASTLRSVRNLYPSLFDIFKNTSFILKWFKPYMFTFVPFMTGIFAIHQDEYGLSYEVYSLGPDIYPANLWNAIK